ncbi:hypothetical protein CH75_13445 [Dyella jiangningensis]|jgi:hypothetical protein|nr:hypothetical protein CH75_13445 [Dyella jiangningensis]
MHTASPEGMSMSKRHIHRLAWAATPLVTLAWFALPLQAMAQDHHHRDYAPPHYEHDRHGHYDRDDRDYHEYHEYHHDHDDTGAIVAGALLGVAAGTVIVNANTPQPPPTVVYTSPPPPPPPGVVYYEDDGY